VHRLEGEELLVPEECHLEEIRGGVDSRSRGAVTYPHYNTQTILNIVAGIAKAGLQVGKGLVGEEKHARGNFPSAAGRGTKTGNNFETLSVFK
jgi:hypothetical protein